MKPATVFDVTAQADFQEAIAYYLAFVDEITAQGGISKETAAIAAAQLVNAVYARRLSS